MTMRVQPIGRKLRVMHRMMAVHPLLWKTVSEVIHPVLMVHFYWMVVTWQVAMLLDPGVSFFGEGTCIPNFISFLATPRLCWELISEKKEKKVCLVKGKVPFPLMTFGSVSQLLSTHLLRWILLGNWSEYPSILFHILNAYIQNHVFFIAYSQFS